MMDIDLQIVRHDKMFPFVHGYKHIIEGCDFNCTYCWQRRKECPRKIVPTFHPNSLNYQSKPNTIIFINPRSDTFCKGVLPDWIRRIFAYIDDNPLTVFLMMTKNPQGYLDYCEHIPDNVILGATIETNWCTTQYSKAPNASERIEAMQKLEWKNKFLSIEPIMRFGKDFIDDIARIGPRWVAIGYDNYGNYLVEPSLNDTYWLISEMEYRGIKIFRKTLRERWDI